MGADLYIKTIRRSHKTQPDNEQSTKHDPAASVLYFRDPYNFTSVLWTLGLSWWRDVLPLLDANQELKGQTLQRFRDQVMCAYQRLPTVEDLQREKVRVDATGERSVAELHRYYIQRRKQLLRFLNFAISNRAAITCSL